MVNGNDLRRPSGGPSGGAHLGRLFYALVRSSLTSDKILFTCFGGCMNCFVYNMKDKTKVHSSSEIEKVSSKLVTASGV